MIGLTRKPPFLVPLPFFTPLRHEVRRDCSDHEALFISPPPHRTLPRSPPHGLLVQTGSLRDDTVDCHHLRAARTPVPTWWTGPRIAATILGGHGSSQRLWIGSWSSHGTATGESLRFPPSTSSPGAASSPANFAVNCHGSITKNY